MRGCALPSALHQHATCPPPSQDLATNVQVSLVPEAPKAGEHYSLTLEFDLPQQVSDIDVCNSGLFSARSPLKPAGVWRHCQVLCLPERPARVQRLC